MHVHNFKNTMHGTRKCTECKATQSMQWMNRVDWHWIDDEPKYPHIVIHVQHKPFDIGKILIDCQNAMHFDGIEKMEAQSVFLALTEATGDGLYRALRRYFYVEDV